MPFVDTHCHLDFSEFDERRDAVVRECGSHNIETLIVPGVECKSWRRVLSLQAKYKQVRVALGLHPYFIGSHLEDDLVELSSFLEDGDQRIVAVGEIGLDDDRPNYERQCYFFEEQLKLAERHQLPVIMHMRKNHGQGLKRVRQRNLVGGVVHAFSGSVEDANAWIEQGMKIGVGGVITYERAEKTRRTIAQLPIESLVLETDSPDMAISGVSAGLGSPMLLLDIFKALCELRPEPHVELMDALWLNSRSVFRI